MAIVKRFVLMAMLVEVLLLICICGVIWFWHAPSGKSALLGGLTFIVPNTYFAIYAFRYSGASLTPWIVRSFSLGHTGKLCLIALAFALVFHYHQDLHHGTVFFGFIVMILVHLLIATFISNRLSRMISVSAAEAQQNPKRFS